MDLLNNANIAGCVVQRVPCAFAKSKDGITVGTHYAMVLLDKNGNVMYVGSECEHTNGEGIQALHELGEAEDTCFQVTDKFRKLLGHFHAKAGELVETFNYSNLAVETRELPTMLRAAFAEVFDHAREKHNQNVVNRRWEHGHLQEESPTQRKQRLLQAAANRVAYNLLGLKPLVLPNSTEIVHTQAPPIFKVAYGKWHTGQMDKLELEQPRDLYALTMESWNLVTVALRDYPQQGNWFFNEDGVKRWAQRNHTVELKPQQLGIPAPSGEEYCIYCKESFKRISKHVKGAKHIETVVNFTKTVCRATSKLGLQFLNNPRHKSAFIR